MNEYDLDGSQLVPRDAALPQAETAGHTWRAETAGRTGRPGPRRVDQLLAAARAQLRRLSPAHAYEALASGGAVLVDIRPQAQRSLEGTIAGAVVVERNVLEWRFDPASSSRLPIATSHDLAIIVICSEGYTSSLAAAALQHLGLWRATDVVGGFQAWRSLGLPIAPGERNE